MTAHLFNFTLNGQVFVCVRYCRFFRRSPDVLDEWLQKRVLRLKASGWLDEALCLGSKGTGERARSARSDIDLRLITPVGIAGWLRTNLLLLSLRSEAFFRAIPLDLYAYDRIESLKRFDGAEPLLIVLDRKGRLARTFAHRPLTRA